MLSSLHTMSHKGRVHVCILASFHVMSHRGREHLCILSMLHTASYRGREPMCMHHLCCDKPTTIARVEPDCVEPTNKLMWCTRCVQCLEYAWCRVHHGAGLLNISVYSCRVCFVEVFLHPEDCSGDLLEWGARLAEYNARPPRH